MSDCCLFAKTSVPNQDIVKEIRSVGMDVGTYLVGRSDLGAPRYDAHDHRSGAAFSRLQKEWQVLVDLLQDDLQRSVQNRVRDYQEADMIRKEALERANTLAQCLRVTTKVSGSDARQVAQVYANLNHDLQRQAADEEVNQTQLERARRTVRYSELSEGLKSIILLTFDQTSSTL